MQTNRHRVSEVAVTSKHKTNKDDVKNDTRTAIKRLREHDNSDTELEIDDIVSGSNLSAALPDLSIEGGATPGPQQDSSKSDYVESDTTVYLSLDWENEEPYEKAVERYFFLSCLVTLSFLFFFFWLSQGGIVKFSLSLPFVFILLECCVKVYTWVLDLRNSKRIREDHS